jgi:hypothetical protein
VALADADDGATGEEASPIQPRRRSNPSSGRRPEVKAPPAPNFFSRLAQMSDTDWERHRIYVYRRWPQITRDDSPHYIGVHRQAIDEEFVKNLYGSGRYLLKLNDPKRTIDQTALEIQDLAFPPKVSPDELVSCPENERYFRLWPQESQKPAGNGSRQRDDVAEIIRAARDGNKLDPTVIAWLQDMANRRDDLAAKLAERPVKNPAGDLAELLAALKTVLPSQPAPAADPLQIVNAVLAATRKEGDIDLVDRVWKFFERVQTAAKPRGDEEDPLEKLTKHIDAMSKLKTLFQADGSTVIADGSGWQGLTSTVIQALPATLSSVAGVIAALKNAPAGAPASPLTGAVPSVGGGAFDPYARPDLARQFVRNGASSAPQSAFAARAAAAGAATPSPLGDASQSAPPAQPADDEITSQVLILVNQSLSCLNRGVDGHQCAQALIDLNGDLIYRRLVQQINGAGIPVVVELAKGIPEVGMQVAAYEPALKQFIAQFLEGPDDYDEPESESEELPAV